MSLKSAGVKYTELNTKAIQEIKSQKKNNQPICTYLSIGFSYETWLANKYIIKVVIHEGNPSQ